MNREEKNAAIAELTEKFKNANCLYIADTSSISAIDTNNFRRELFKNDIEMLVAKNTLILKAMRNSGKEFGELEGALIKLMAKISLDSRELGLDLAKEVVRGIAGISKQQLTIHEIAVEVASYYQVPVELLSGKTRKHEIVIARQMSMYLAKSLIGTSLKGIGLHFGGRDHTTVLHSCQTIDNYLCHDVKVRAALDVLKKSLTHR